MTLVYGKNRLAAMPTYRRVCKFAISIHFLAMTILYKTNTCIFSILIQLHGSEALAYKSCRNRIHKSLTPGSSRVNACFISTQYFIFLLWFSQHGSTYFYPTVVIFILTQVPYQLLRPVAFAVHPRVCLIHY